MNNTTSAPDTGPIPLPLSLRLRRVAALLDVLSDALQGDADYSPHFKRRSLAVDLAACELETITNELEWGKR
jgi:hypothetical protein